MTDTESVAQDTETAEQIEQRERAAYVSGLRQLATFIEAHPSLPLPYAGSHNAFVETKAELAALARVGVKWQKTANDDFFTLRFAFDGHHSYEANVERAKVCRKVVIGTRIEPAQPEREVEEYHWVCDEPLLADGAK